MRLRSSSPVPALLLLLLCAALFLPGLRRLPATDRDEAQFAETTREMIQSGDFIRPRFQNRDFFQKPIGLYWAQSVFVKMLGPSDRTRIWPYRLPSAIAAVIAVLMTLRIGRILFDDSVALLAAALMAACPLLVVEAHLGTTDAMLLACTTIAMASLAAIYKSLIASETPRVREAITLWIAMGLAILLKGPVLPALFFATVGALALTERSIDYPSSGIATRWLKALRPQWALLTLAIVLPWVIGIAAVSGGSFFHIFWREVGVKVSRVNLRHGGPPGYYLLLATVTFWPGSLLALVALGIALRSDKTFGHRFCLAWLVPAWIVLELIPTKLPHYVLPLFPALALLTASAALAAPAEAKVLTRTALGRTSIGMWAIGALLIGGAWIAAPIFLGESAHPLDFLPALVMIALAIAGFRLIRAGRITATLCSSIFALVLIYPIVFGTLLPRMSGLWLSEEARGAIVHAEGISDRPVVAVGYHEPSLAFDLNRPVMMLDRKAAIDFLRTHHEAIILTDVEDETALTRNADGYGIKLSEVWTFSGYNYTRGAVTRLALVECADCPPAGRTGK